jgi:hypothetical protein
MIHHIPNLAFAAVFRILRPNFRPDFWTDFRTDIRPDLQPGLRPVPSAGEPANKPVGL